jgi:hypothetical protein
MRNHKVVFTLIPVVSVCLFLTWFQVYAADTKMPSGQLYETQVSSSSEPLVSKCDYSLWIPADTPIVRSVFVINMRAAFCRL